MLIGQLFPDLALQLCLILHGCSKISRLLHPFLKYRTFLPKCECVLQRELPLADLVLHEHFADKLPLLLLFCVSFRDFCEEFFLAFGLELIPLIEEDLARFLDAAETLVYSKPEQASNRVAKLSFATWWQALSRSLPLEIIGSAVIVFNFFFLDLQSLEVVSLIRISRVETRRGL